MRRRTQRISLEGPHPMNPVSSKAVSLPAMAAEREGERGIAMAIALIAMTILTILGVAAMSGAELDLRQAHNMRRWEQARYASMAGTEHARLEIQQGNIPSQDQVVYFDEIDATPTYYIDETQAEVLETNNVTLGTYTVQAVAVKCSGPPAGYSIEQYYSQYFDLYSEGVLKDDNGELKSHASSTNALTVRNVQDGKCYKR